MITRFRARGYKSLADVDVDLARLTVVFGPNSAGKSNLLDALGLLGWLVTQDNVDDAFKLHRGAPLEAFTLPAGGTAALQKSASARLWLSVDVQLSDSVVAAVESEIEKRRAGPAAVKPKRIALERHLRYTVEIEIRTDSGHLLVMDERLEALKPDGSPKQSRSPFLEKLSGEDFIRLRHEGQGRPAQEEIGQDRTVVSKRLYAPHYPHVAALREEMASWRFYFLEPALMRQEIALQEVETLAADGGDLAAFYNSVRTRGGAKVFEGYELALRQVVRSADGLEVERTPQGTLRLVVREGDVPLSSRLISEGSLRVLGLLAITNPLRPLSLVGYEEPENGIHATRLAVVATMLLEAAEAGQTQFVLNTHSPVLPEHFQGHEQTALLACRKQEGKTHFTRVAGGTLYAAGEVSDALDDDDTSSLAERLVRGDYA